MIQIQADFYHTKQNMLSKKFSSRRFAQGKEKKHALKYIFSL